MFQLFVEPASDPVKNTDKVKMFGVFLVVLKLYLGTQRYCRLW